MRSGYTTTLPLAVFTQINFVADFIRLKLNCIQKTKNRFLSHPVGLRGNVRTLLLVEKPVLDFLLVIIELFLFNVSYGWDVISGYLSKSAFFERGGSLWAQISDWKGRRPLTTVGVTKLEWLPFRAVSKCLQFIIYVPHQKMMILTRWRRRYWCLCIVYVMQRIMLPSYRVTFAYASSTKPSLDCRRLVHAGLHSRFSHGHRRLPARQPCCRSRYCFSCVCPSVRPSGWLAGWLAVCPSKT